jgi:hypothetical protein
MSKFSCLASKILYILGLAIQVYEWGSCWPDWPDYTIGSNTNPTKLLIGSELVTRTRSNCEPGYATRTHEPVPTPQPQIPIRIAITGENNQSYQTTQSGHGFQTHITRETMFTAYKCQILGSQVRKPKTRKDTALSVWAADSLNLIQREAVSVNSEPESEGRMKLWVWTCEYVWSKGEVMQLCLWRVKTMKWKEKWWWKTERVKGAKEGRLEACGVRMVKWKVKWCG